ncbi:AAA family ATPase [Desulfobacula toluolica]|uniref:Lon protease AAA domain-containing protein n=1 Tax=Desulfobacula toluolica (strain DSM 7467 / Tol2) TaxID=651182 RepID=K0NIE5_DESTT|nr:AAA family ATPase [Desulfobacula toluolica]CCK80720.1 uncharacterized protein TOL2_C25610 [Desulfobacula toluolica Tol2]
MAGKLNISIVQTEKGYQPVPMSSGQPITPLKPKPISVDLKVILLGSYETFRTLQGSDPKFNKIFGVRADFDHEVEVNQENLINYAKFISSVCKKEKLLPFTPCGVTAVVEYGNRIVEDKKKTVSTLWSGVKGFKRGELLGKKGKYNRSDRQSCGKSVKRTPFST